MQEKKIIFRYCIMSGYTTPTGQGTIPTAAQIAAQLEEARRKAREIAIRARKKKAAEASGKNTKLAGGRRRKSRKRKSRKRKSRKRRKSRKGGKSRKGKSRRKSRRRMKGG
jgi:hypothetical protein